MNLEERYKLAIAYFKQQYPTPQTELDHKSPYELIVAVILSAQCTDKRVNLITPDFFKAFPKPEVLASASVDAIFELIKSCSYPNNKAKHLQGMALTLVNKFNNQIPDSVEELQKLPGVGRKSANVIAAVVFNMPTMPVDTHVFRVARRIGLVKGAKTPLETEKQLVKNISTELMPDAHHWLILHGRYVCMARKPKCNECGLKKVCKFYQQMKRI